MKKIKAFTILELMVAMAISSMVISASYMSFDFINKRFKEYKKVGENIAQAVTFSAAINNDINSCKFVRKTPDGVEFVFRDEVNSNPSPGSVNAVTYSVISYILKDEYVLREVKSVKDTFFVVIASTEYRLNGKSVSVGSLLNELHIGIYVNGQLQSFNVKKDYSAEEQMEAVNS